MQVRYDTGVSPPSLSSLYRIFKSVFRGAVTYFRRKRRSVVIQGLRLYYGTKMRLTFFSEKNLGPVSTVRDVIVRIGGKHAFRRIRKLIRHAKASIVIQTFIWKDDETGQRIAQLLLNAARRGVRVQIMKEPLGDFFELDASFAETRNSKSILWRSFWNEENIAINLDSNDDHSKTWIFDGRVVLLSGMNIGEEYEHAWHDFQVELRGEYYAQCILERKVTHYTVNTNVEIVMNSESEMQIRPCIMKLINDAKKSIVIEHCYFTDAIVVSVVAKATKRGVDVTVISPKNPDVNARANLSTLHELLQISDKSHVKIREYPAMFHAKVLMIDNVHCLLGSANLNTLSLDRSGEVCVLLRGNTRGLRKIRRRLQFDVLQSRVHGLPKMHFLSKILGKLGL